MLGKIHVRKALRRAQNVVVSSKTDRNKTQQRRALISAIRPVVENLESRRLLTVVYNPVFGTESPASSAPFSVLISPAIHVLLWGTHWGATAVTEVENEVTAILSSTYLGILSQYGCSGTSGPVDFYVDSSSDPPSNFNPGNLGDGHSLVQAQNEIDNMVNQGHIAAPGHPGFLTLAPIYTIIEDPIDSPTNGGYNSNGPVNFQNVNIDSLGTSGSSASVNSVYLGTTFSHETAEITSDPGGGNNGVVFNLPPNEPTAVGEGEVQVADGEPEPSGQAHYYYRIGGPSSQAIVQPDYSQANQAFAVNDGNSELFELYPNWTIGANNNDSFNGNFSLTVNGDQLSNKNDTIFVGENSSGGVSVTLDGQNVSFDQGQITSVTINSGVGSDSVYIQDTVVPTTINSSSPSAGPDDLVDVGDGSTHGINATLTIQNSTGYDQLVVDDSQDTASQNITVGAFLSTALGVVEGIAPQNIFFATAQTRSLVVDTSSGDDTVYVPTTVVPTTISGHATGGITQLGTEDLFNIGSAGLLANIAQSLTLEDTGLVVTTVDDSADTTGRTLYLENWAVSGFGEIDGFNGNALTGPQIIYQYSGVLNNFTLKTGTASNSINIFATGVNTTIASDSPGGDTVNIGNFGSVAAINDTLSIDNPGHIDAININDVLDNTSHTVTFNTVYPPSNPVAYTEITGLAPGTIEYNDADTFPMNLQLGSGTNTVNILTLSTDAFERIMGGSGNDTINLSPSNANLSYIAGSLDIVGGSGTTSVFAYDDNDANTATYTLSYGFNVGDLDVAGFGGMAFTQIQNISFVAGLAADVIDVQETAPGTTTSVDSAGGEDAVNVGEQGLTDGIEGTLNIRQTGGEGNVTINDSADTTAENVTLNNASTSGFGAVTGISPGEIEYSYADTDVINVMLGSARNTVHAHATGAGVSTTFTGGRAGYFETDPGATVTLFDFLVNGGSTSPSGITNSGSLSLVDSTITNNAGSGDGAGVDNLGTIDIYDCALFGNSTTGYGGALYNQGTMDVDDSTISNNYATAGAGVYNNSSGHLTFDNSIAFFDLGGEITSFGTVSAEYSDIQQSGGPAITYPGQGDINENPDFVSGSFQLQSDSPCINAGYNLIAAIAYPDLADRNRIVGGTVDMGAYEYQGANPARTLVFSEGPPATININVGMTLVVYVENQSGGLVNDPTTVTLSISGTGGGALAGGQGGGAPTALAFGGIATFNNISITAAGNYVITASATYLGDTPAVSGNITVTNPAVVPSLAFVVQPSNVAAGAVMTPPVVVDELVNGSLDMSDSQTYVSLNVGQNQVATVQLNEGVGTFTNIVLNTTGTFDLIASDGGDGLATSQNFTVTAPLPTISLAIGALPSVITANNAISPGITVTEEQANGTALTGDNSSSITLSLTSFPNGGTITGTLTQKVSGGKAVFNGLIPTANGDYTISASDGNDVTAQVTFGVGAQLVFIQQPGAFTLGPNIPVPAFTVAIEDGKGDVIDSNDTISIQAMGPTIRSYGGVTQLKASNGTATFTQFFVGVAATDNFLEATDLTNPGDGPGYSNTFAVSPGPAEYLQFGSETGGTAGDSTSLTVDAVDVTRNLATSYNGLQNFTLVSGPLGATLGGIYPVDFQSGVGTVNDIVLTEAGTYTIESPDTTLGARDISFTINPSDATHLIFIQQPGNTAPGFAIAPTIIVGAEDAFNNVIPNYTSSVTLSVATPAGTVLNGDVTIATQSGQAAFDDVSINALGTYTLSAVDLANPSIQATSNPFSIVAPVTIYVDQNAKGNDKGQTWPNAFTNLQSALAVAIPGDTIDVAQGDYSPGSDPTDTFQLLDGVTLQGGFSTGGKSGPDPAVYPTLLDGTLNGSNNSYHVVTASGTSPTAILEGFTITGGNANGNGDADSGMGGGLIADGGAPTVINCTFTNNDAQSGGAVYVANEAGTFATIDNSIFIDNFAGAYGGAIYNLNASPTLVNDLFVGNSGAESAGAVYNVSSSPTITNCTVSLNTSGFFGGAIDNEASNPIITNSILWNDTTSGTDTEISNDLVLGGAMGFSAPVVTTSDLGDGYSGTQTIDSDPLFIDPVVSPELGNFQLQQTSPCINDGTNSAVAIAGVATDLAGNPRIIDGVVDMGAYEAQLPGVVWTGLADGINWSNPGNWSDHLVPTQNDIVTIPSGYDPQIGSGSFAVHSLTILGTSMVDVGSGSLAIDYGKGNPSPLSSVRAELLSGYNNGAWNGPGIISSAAAAKSGYAIAYADGGTDSGTPAQPGQILLQYDLVGDANLDGTVNLTDLLTLLNSYGQTGKDWSQGDFNYDGTVNLTDLLALLNNYGQSASDTSIATNSLASVVRPAATVTSYQAKSSPFTSAPLTLNSSGSLVGQTTNVLDIDANILQPDAGTIL